MLVSGELTLRVACRGHALVFLPVPAPCLLLSRAPSLPACPRTAHAWVRQLIQEDGRLYNALLQMTAEGMYPPGSPTYATSHRLLAAIGEQGRRVQDCMPLSLNDPQSLTDQSNSHPPPPDWQGTMSGGPR